MQRLLHRPAPAVTDSRVVLIVHFAGAIDLPTCLLHSGFC
ncbi:Unknown protein sequence [Pseudomonas syringae pv. maculicola str. M6]|nr:Unknown protein sequence [Pseudomonas syringae pv. maculicola str. M6]